MLVFSLVELQEPMSQVLAVAKIESQLATIAVHAANAPVLLVGTRKGQVKAGQGQEALEGALRVLHALLHSELSRRSPAYRWVQHDEELVSAIRPIDKCASSSL
jgi:hypothetical protein